MIGTFDILNWVLDQQSATSSNPKPKDKGKGKVVQIPGKFYLFIWNLFNISDYYFFIALVPVPSGSGIASGSAPVRVGKGKLDF